MTKPHHYHSPIPAWKINRKRLYDKLGALGGMADHANTKIRPDFSFQGKLWLALGSRPEWSDGKVFEVRVMPSCTNEEKVQGYSLPYAHRISVRCPRCHTWTPFGRLHQHILSQRCLATAEIANGLPSVLALRSALL